MEQFVAIGIEYMISVSGACPTDYIVTVDDDTAWFERLNDKSLQVDSRNNNARTADFIMSLNDLQQATLFATYIIDYTNHEISATITGDGGDIGGTARTFLGLERDD